MRKTQTWYGNAFDAGINYSCKTVVGLDQRKQYVSNSHTFGKWFSHFMKGACLRMGMVCQQNEALTLMLVLAMCRAAKAAWQSTQVTSRQVQIEDTVCFMLLTFGAGLREEEGPFVDLGGLLPSWKPERKMISI
jgi:hypothetical protein